MMSKNIYGVDKDEWKRERDRGFARLMGTFLVIAIVLSSVALKAKQVQGFEPIPACTIARHVGFVPIAKTDGTTVSASVVVPEIAVNRDTVGVYEVPQFPYMLLCTTPPQEDQDDG